MGFHRAVQLALVGTHLKGHLILLVTPHTSKARGRVTVMEGMNFQVQEFVSFLGFWLFIFLPRCFPKKIRKKILAIGCNVLLLWKIENFWGTEILGIPVRKRGLILTLSSGISLRSSNFCIVTANIPGWFRDTGDWWQVRRPSKQTALLDSV